MTARRRMIAFLTTLAVAWTALWPLVSSAHALWTEEPVMLCHQAGMQVTPGEMPMRPTAPGEPVQHCPLCIMAFYGGFTVPPQPAASIFFVVSPIQDAYFASLASPAPKLLPPSRAPPC